MNPGFPAARIPAASAFRDMRLPSGRPMARWLDDTFLPDTGPAGDSAAELLDMRQLRHQTNNALQRILGVLMAAPQDAGVGWIEDLGRRIRLSAEISNALFGLTRAPGPMQARLETLAGAVVALMSDPGQVVDVQVVVDGDCPAALRDAVIRVAHEFIGNAMKHGLRARPRGAIRVSLSCRAGSQVRLLVSDDGRGFDVGSTPGEGIGLANALALHLRGTVTLRQRRTTEAELLLPARPAGWGAPS